MLTKTLKRVLTEAPTQWPPTFLLPWAANLSARTFTKISRDKRDGPRSSQPARTQRKQLSTTTTSSQADSQLPPPTASAPLETAAVSSSVLDLLPLLRSQGSHYITLHIHGKPYLVTQGDTIRLPFLMPNVEAGDVLRLNRALTVGSRDYTLKPAAPPPKLKSATASTISVLDPTSGSLASHSRVMPTGDLGSSQTTLYAPHYIPHIAKQKHSYLDERLFVCRAVVMGVESEPMRLKEKTKRRQRHVKTVKSKHRFTILKIKEVSIKSPEEIKPLADS